jgi:hypothetical protein
MTDPETHELHPAPDTAPGIPTASEAAAPVSGAAPAPPPRPRPIIERIGMAFIALVLGSLFAVVGAAAFVGGEPFLGVMGAIGCLMVLWVGGLTLFKGH